MQGYMDAWIHEYKDTRISEYMYTKIQEYGNTSMHEYKDTLLRDSTLHIGPAMWWIFVLTPLLDFRSKSELSESSGASEQSRPLLRYVASERYGVSERSGASESSGASIEE